MDPTEFTRKGHRAAHSGICGPRLHRLRRGLRAPGVDRGGGRGLAKDVRLARHRADHRRRRRHVCAAAAHGGAVAALVRRCARSRRRYPHLRVRAGLCHRHQRAVAARSGDSARRAHRRHRLALFRRPADEDGGLLFPRLSGAVERGGVLSVPAQAAAVVLRARSRRARGADLRAVPRRASDPDFAPARDYGGGAGGLGTARRHCGRGWPCARLLDCCGALHFGRSISSASVSCAAIIRDSYQRSSA